MGKKTYKVFNYTKELLLKKERNLSIEGMMKYIKGEKGELPNQAKGS